MSEVAIAILNYNGAHHLIRFLPSVIRYSKGASVYVIDNASTDNSMEVLEKFKEISVIQLSRNHGFAEGYNLGLKEIDAKYYVILNSDVEVTPNWLDPMVEFLENNSEYATCQPKILAYHHKKRFEYAGAAGGFIDFFGYPFCRGRIFDTMEEDHGQYDTPADILWTTGACFIIRARSFHGADGFDKDFFAHMEEIDLCWRLYSEGNKAICLPKTTVYHVGGGTLPYGSTHKTYLNFRNCLIMLLKNLPISRLLYVLPARLVLDLIAGLKLGATSHFPSVLKAHFHFYRSFHVHFRKRKVCKTPSKELNGQKFLVYQYFLRKKRKFSAF